MTDPIKRLDYCFAEPSNAPAALTISFDLVPPLLYLPLMFYTFSKYKVLGMNKFLLISWAFESFMRIFFIFIEQFAYEGLEVPKQYFYAIALLNTINMLIFSLQIFLLKTVQIYMDSRNKTEEDIKR